MSSWVQEGWYQYCLVQYTKSDNRFWKYYEFLNRIEQASIYNFWRHLINKPPPFYCRSDHYNSLLRAAVVLRDYLLSNIYQAAVNLLNYGQHSGNFTSKAPYRHGYGSRFHRIVFLSSSRNNDRRIRIVHIGLFKQIKQVVYNNDCIYCYEVTMVA